MCIHTKYHDERDPQIVAARREGKTYKAIGEQWGISGGRVRQIVWKAGRKERRAALLAADRGQSNE